MAGDYIIIRCDLPDEPEVIAIADRLQIPGDLVVGKLVRFWSWANMHLTNGHAPGVTELWLDEYLRCAGFARALESVGWLEVNKSGLTVPKFDSFNSKGGKKRLLAAKRQKKKRDASVTPQSRPPRDKSVTTEQKRREEKEELILSDRKTSPGGQPSDPTLLTLDFLGSIAGQVQTIFRRLGYTGNDGALIWKSVALADMGRLQESWVAGASEGARLNAKGNSVGYYRTSLADHAASDGITLSDQLATVKLPPGFPTGPPK